MDTFPPLASAALRIWVWIVANLSTAIAAGAGTFAGAYLAFRFERGYKEKKEQSMNLLAGKKAQFALMSQITLLKNLRKNYLDPRKADANRELMLTPVSVHARPISLDLASLQCFLEDDGAEILNKLIVAEQRFGSCLGILEQRNQRHEQAQCQLAATNTLDPARHAILKDLTNALYDGVDDALILTKSRSKHLLSIYRSDFRKKRC